MLLSIVYIHLRIFYLLYVQHIFFVLISSFLSSLPVILVRNIETNSNKPHWDFLQAVICIDMHRPTHVSDSETDYSAVSFLVCVKQSVSLTVF